MIDNQVDNQIAKKNVFNNYLKNYFNLFVVILTTFLLVMSYFLLLKPKVDETTTAISDNITQQQRIYQAEESKLRSLEATVAAYKQINPIDLAKVESILPNDYSKEKLFGELEEIIVRNGFEPNSITINKDVEADATNPVEISLAPVSDKVGLISISLSIGSIDYANLKNFLGILENNIRIFDITNVSMGDRSANLQLITYYYKK